MVKRGVIIILSLSQGNSEMKFITGRVSHQLDAKTRIRIPVKYKSAFPEGEKLYFFEYNAGRIAVMPESVLAEKMKLFNDVTPGDEDAMDAMAKLYSSMEEVTEDTQGRTQIPKQFREYANIRKDVVTVGMGNYVEIWAQEEYDARIGSKTMKEVNASLYKKNDGTR